MNESGMLKPALIGGVLLGVCSAIPVVNLLNCVCCAWVIVGGGLAAYLFVKDSGIPVTMGRGVTLGLLTGVFGTVVSTVISLPLRLMMNTAGMNVMEQMRQALDRVPNMPPETRQIIEKLAASGNMGIAVFIVGILFSLIINCLFAMAGGAIGVAVFEKRKGGPATMDVPPYQPPSNPPPPPTDAV
jgi:hypothetical protein